MPGCRMRKRELPAPIYRPGNSRRAKPDWRERNRIRTIVEGIEWSPGPRVWDARYGGISLGVAIEEPSGVVRLRPANTTDEIICESLRDAQRELKRYFTK